MENEENNVYVNPGEFYFPFSELVLHDEFIIHTSCLNDVNMYASPEFIKTGKNTYKNSNTQEEHEILDENVHKLRVALAPTSAELAFV